MNRFRVGDRVMWRDKYSPRRYGTVIALRTIDYEIRRDDGKEIVRGVGLWAADDPDFDASASEPGAAPALQRGGGPDDPREGEGAP